MREDICSIPINDVFEPKCGCPICRMRDMLEDRISTYITGAAMMEPAVRVETNRLGFCKEHFDHILKRGNRLSIALILESLLDETYEETFAKKTNPKKIPDTLVKRTSSCFICENVEANMRHLFSSMIQLWLKENEFRQLYNEQEFICLPHYKMVLESTQKMPKTEKAEFVEATTKLSKNYLDTLKADVTHFCRMFDYRNAGGDWGNSKDSIERAIKFYTSRDAEVEIKADEKNR